MTIVRQIEYYDTQLDHLCDKSRVWNGLHTCHFVQPLYDVLIVLLLLNYYFPCASSACFYWLLPSYQKF